MKILFVLLMSLVAQSLTGQERLGRLRDKAFDFYLNKKQFDSSLFYYQQISREFPATRPIYISNQIGDCYLELGDTANAEKHYLRCLSFDRNKDSLGLSQIGSCFALSSIYYDRRDFNQALVYLNYTKTKYRPLIRLCQGTHGGYEGRLHFAYKKALCYYGLGKKDSTIIELAPLIFRPREDVYLDSLEFENMTRFFVNTVFEVYGEAKAREDLNQALNNLIYTPAYEEDKRFNMIFFSVDCHIVFANATIYLIGGGGYQVDKKGDIPEFFSIQTLLKEFIDSPAYQYIMDCDKQSLAIVL